MFGPDIVRAKQQGLPRLRFLPSPIRAGNEPNIPAEGISRFGEKTEPATSENPLWPRK